MQVASTSTPIQSNAVGPAAYASPPLSGSPSRSYPPDATRSLIDQVLGRPSYAPQSYADPYVGAQQQSQTQSSSSSQSASSSVAQTPIDQRPGIVTAGPDGKPYYLVPATSEEINNPQAVAANGAQLVNGSDGKVYLAFLLTAEQAASIQAAQQQQQQAGATAQSGTSAANESQYVQGSDGKTYQLVLVPQAELANAQAAAAKGLGTLVQDDKGNVYFASPVESQGGGTTPAQTPTQSQGPSQPSAGGAPRSQGGNDYRFSMDLKDPGGTSAFVGPSVNLANLVASQIPELRNLRPLFAPKPKVQSNPVAPSTVGGGGGGAPSMIAQAPTDLSSGNIGTSSLKSSTFDYDPTKGGGVFGKGTPSSAGGNALSNPGAPGTTPRSGGGSGSQATQAKPEGSGTSGPAGGAQPQKNEALSRGLGLGSGLLGSASEFANAAGAPQGVVKGLQVGSAVLDTTNNIVNNRPVDAALSGLGGVAALVGGKTGKTLSNVVSIGSTVKGIVGNLRAGGPVGIASAAGSAFGLAANFIKGTAGKVLSGLGQAATTAVGAFKAVASGVSSVAGAVGGGIVAGVGIIASLIGGKVGKWVSNIAGIVAPLLMSNPIGAIIGGIGMLAGLLFRKRPKFTSDQQADLLGRGAGLAGTPGGAPGAGGAAAGASGGAINPGAVAGATDPNAAKPLDRLHRTANNELVVYINDGTGKEVRTQTLNMGGYFDKKSKAGQDKLVDLLNRGLPDLIWQGDKKNANHITTFINLGGGKFGDPLAEQRAAERMNRMDEYIRANPKPVIRSYFGDPLGAQREAERLSLLPGGTWGAGDDPESASWGTADPEGLSSNLAVVQRANEWLDGLAKAVNGDDAKPLHLGITHWPKAGPRPGEPVPPPVAGKNVGDQTRATGVSNPYGLVERQLSGRNGNPNSIRGGGDKFGNYRNDNTQPSASEPPYQQSKLNPRDFVDPATLEKLDARTRQAGADPTKTPWTIHALQRGSEERSRYVAADATDRISRTIDDGIDTMRKQIQEQAKPEGRVYAEQTLDLKVKGYDAEQMKFADVNDDGAPDMIMSGKGVQTGTWVFLNKGDATFETKGIDISAEVAALEAKQKAAEAGATPTPTQAPAAAPPAAPPAPPAPVASASLAPPKAASSNATPFGTPRGRPMALGANNVPAEA